MTEPTPKPHLIHVSVLVTPEQKEEVLQLTDAMRTPENRLKMSSVIRRALTLGLAELRRQTQGANPK
jgi:hypothetical protein